MYSPEEIARQIGTAETKREIVIAAGAQFQRIGDALLTISKASTSIYPSQNLNHVLNFGVDAPASGELVDQIVDAYRSAQVTHFFLYLSPTAQAQHIDAWLRQRQFEVRNQLDVLYRDTSQPTAASTILKIACLSAGQYKHWADWKAQHDTWDCHDAKHWLSIANHPDTDVFVALDNDSIVASALLSVSSNLGWLGMAATLEGYRAQGAQNALIAARIERARERACSAIYSETYQKILAGSFRNLIRNGFRHVYARPIYFRKL